MANGKKVLVTGATGQQGGATARELLAKGFAVRVMTRNPGSEKAVALKKLSAEVVKGDLDDRSSLEAAVKDVWGVFALQNTWEAGVDGAVPGIIMKADPKVGDVYQQEYLEGEAEDMAEVLEVDASVEVPYSSFNQVIKTKEWTPLEPGVVEEKYYAPGLGLVLTQQVEGGSDWERLIALYGF